MPVTMFHADVVDGLLHTLREVGGGIGSDADEPKFCEMAGLVQAAPERAILRARRRGKQRSRRNESRYRRQNQRSYFHVLSIDTI